MAATCVWSQEDEDSEVWYTECNNIFRLENGTPEGNNFQYCCFCGDKLVQDEFVEDEDEDGEDEE